jgi:hypothetical protein
MTNMRRSFQIGLHALMALSAGAGIMSLLDGSKWRPDGAGSAASPAFPARSLESGKSEAMALLGTAARDPYAKLSDAEIAMIAASLDMAKESSWRLLNAVISPDLCWSLWDACIRANVGKIDLQELMAVAKHGAGRNGMDIYGGIFEAIRERGSEKEELTTPLGKTLVQNFLFYMSSRVETFDELMTLVPKGMSGAYREWAMFQWTLNPTEERVGEILSLSPGEGGPGALRIAAKSWSKLKPDEQAALMQDVDRMPEARRNRFLAEILEGHGAADDASELDLLARITSYSQQQVVVSGMIKEDFAPGVDADLLAWMKEKIASSPHAAELQRISAFLEEQKPGPGEGEVGYDPFAPQQEPAAGDVGKEGEEPDRNASH